MGSYLLLLYVSEEQENAIECLFVEKNWEFDKLDKSYLPNQLIKAIQKLRNDCQQDVNKTAERNTTTVCLRKKKVENDYKASRKKPKIEFEQKAEKTRVCDKSSFRLKKTKTLQNKTNENKDTRHQGTKTEALKIKYCRKSNRKKTITSSSKVQSDDALENDIEKNLEEINKTGDELFVEKGTVVHQVLSPILEKGSEAPIIDVTESQKNHLVMCTVDSSQDTNCSSQSESVSNNDKTGVSRTVEIKANTIIDYSLDNQNLCTVDQTVKSEIENMQTNARVTDVDMENDKSLQSVEVKKETEKGNVIVEGGKKSLDVIKNIVIEKVKDRARHLKKNGTFKKIKIPIKASKSIQSHRLEQENDLASFDLKRFKKKDDFYVCPHCCRRFQWVGPFKKHIARHVRNEFDCKECGKQFTNYRSLMAHKYSRQKSRLFTCELCSFSAATACLLRKHGKEKHPPEVFFQCHMCPKILKTKSYLNVHLKHYHNIYEGKFECEICGKISKRPKLFAKHMKLHEQELPDDNLTCTDCGKTFQSKLHLRSHSRIHKDKKFLCDFCGKGFCTKTKLNEHKRTHTGEKPFSCNQCDYSSTQRGNLKLHMKVHDKEKITPEKHPYKCQHCDYTVNRVTSFLQHMKSHEKTRDKRVVQTQKKTAAMENVTFTEPAQEENDNIESEKQKEQNNTENSNYYGSGETELIVPVTSEKDILNPVASSAQENSKNSKNKSMKGDKDTDNSTVKESQLNIDDNGRSIGSDVNGDPSVWTPDYFRTYMAEQYNTMRSGYQETAPHLMYLNQQRYYEANSSMYDNNKETQTTTELYSESKYSADATNSKSTGAANRSYSSSSKSDINMQNLFLPSSGQIWRQIIAASQDMYSDSNTYNSRNQYQDSESAYDMSYSGMYMQEEEEEINDTSDGQAAHKYQDYNTAVKSNISRPASSYSTHHLDTYSSHGHDFTASLPGISSDHLLQYTNRKDETSLYQTAGPTDVRLSENITPAYPHSEQEYTYEDLEPSSVSNKTVQ